MRWSRISLKLLLHRFLSNENDVSGHFSTQIVLQPNNGIPISKHLAKSENCACGLSLTRLSIPHIRPIESTGKTTRFKSPYVKAIFKHEHAVTSCSFQILWYIDKNQFELKSIGETYRSVRCSPNTHRKQ